jgi:hypothetical protein
VPDIGKIDQAEKLAVNFLNGVPNAWGTSTPAEIATYTNLITAAVNDADQNSLTGIKDTTTAGAVAAFFATITNAVTQISQL